MYNLNYTKQRNQHSEIITDGLIICCVNRTHWLKGNATLTSSGHDECRIVHEFSMASNIDSCI